MTDAPEKKVRRKKAEGDDEEGSEYSSDEDYRLTLEENINHILRDKRVEEEEKFGKIVDGRVLINNFECFF